MKMIKIKRTKKNINNLKLQSLKYILENEMQSMCFTKNNIIFQLPFMGTNENDMLNLAENANLTKSVLVNQGIVAP